MIRRVLVCVALAPAGCGAAGVGDGSAGGGDTEGAGGEDGSSGGDGTDSGTSDAPGSGSDGDTGPGPDTFDCGMDGPELLLGRCIRESDGLDCTGAVDEVMEYVALADNDGMRMVVGPQGADMLVFLARTTDIFPGDPQMPASTDNPEVEIVVTNPAPEEDEEDLISYYRGHIAFAPNAPGGDLISTSGLFAIVEHDVDGLALHVEAQVTDKDGVSACTAIDIVVEP